MKIIKENLKENTVQFAPLDVYFKNKQFAVFDIETTGLSPKKSALILSGFLFPNPDGTFTSLQIFAENLDEEESVIIETISIISQLDYVVTFYGSGFDMPFLEKRANYYNIPYENTIYNMDIYVFLRKYSDLKKFLPNLKQKTIENFMGYYSSRTDQIDGAQSIDEYYEFLESQDEEALAKVLLHNKDDICQLYKLMNVLKKVDFHRAMCIEGYLFQDFHLTTLKLKKTQLIVTGHQSKYDYMEYNDERNFECSLNSINNAFEIKFILHTTEGITFFINNGIPIVLSENNNVKYRELCLFINKFLEQLTTSTLKYL